TNSELLKEAEKLKLEAKTIMYFTDDKNTLAIIAVSDKIKPTSASAIYDLQKKGIEVILLTGDNYQTAKVVAEATGIKTFKADMLPEDKFRFIKDLQSKNKVVAMVGDGINDSPALAQADVSIAMGKGSDIAINVAKVTIINSDLKFIAKTIEISTQTVATIKENLFWAFIYNLIGIPIAAGAFYTINGFLLNPAFAAAAMAFSSISVVLNSLRLKYKK
ncbi:MAG: HAD-IC family P-type ATPase, partial [Bacteroidales bacterium]|nr:HAD-IC family P-type ATPase [Bacteroidales bacterium]